RETIDVVEQIGVERSRAAVHEADLILLVLNNAELLHEDEIHLMEQLRGRQTIVLINKIDLPAQLNREVISRYFPEEAIVELSVKTEEGLDHLEDAISKLFFGGQLESGDLTYVSNVRHIAL